MVVGQGHHGYVAGPAANSAGEIGQADLKRHREQGHPQGQPARAAHSLLSQPDIVDRVDRVPEDSHRRRDHKGTHNQGGDALQLPVAVGMLEVSRRAGPFHEYRHDQVVDDIRGRVDAVRQQRRAVAEHADAGLQDGQQHIRRQPHLDGQHALLFALSDIHQFPSIACRRDSDKRVMVRPTRPHPPPGRQIARVPDRSRPRIPGSPWR